MRWKGIIEFLITFIGYRLKTQKDFVLFMVDDTNSLIYYKYFSLHLMKLLYMMLRQRLKKKNKTSTPTI